MREKEKHLMDIPLNRLSKLSGLVVALRNTDIEALNQYDTFEGFCSALLNIEVNGTNDEIDLLLKVIADLIMEAVYKT